VPQGEQVPAFHDEPADYAQKDYDGTDDLNHWIATRVVGCWRIRIANLLGYRPKVYVLEGSGGVF
jgi:hypothetical protein